MKKLILLRICYISQHKLRGQFWTIKTGSERVNWAGNRASLSEERLAVKGLTVLRTNKSLERLAEKMLILQGTELAPKKTGNEGVNSTKNRANPSEVTLAVK
jgi:hypothetical protein